jgi:hypothetical protein
VIWKVFGVVELYTEDAGLAKRVKMYGIVPVSISRQRISNCRLNYMKISRIRRMKMPTTPNEKIDKFKEAARDRREPRRGALG